MSAPTGGRVAVQGYGFLALSIVLWGTSFWPIEMAAGHASPLAVAALRACLAGLVLVAVLPLLRARLPGGAELGWAALSGMLMVGVFFYGLIDGAIRAGAANAAVLANTSPFVVVILASLVLREPISRIGAAGLVVGFSGVVLMVSAQLGAGARDDVAVGFAVALAASVAWAVGTLQVKRVVERKPDLDLVGFTAAQFAVGGGALALLALLVGGEDVSWGAGGLWAPMAYLAVGGSAVASMAYFASLKRLSATRVAAGQFLIPGVAVLVDIARGVSPTPIVALGMALTILGVALVNRPPRRRAAGGVRDRLVVSRRAASAAVEEGSSGDAPSRPCA